MVTAAGGTGIPVRVDHTVEDEVVALFERVGREQHGLDVLAIVMTGQPATWKTFLKESPSDGRAFVESWIWPHIVTAWHAARVMVQQRSGLIVELVEQELYVRGHVVRDENERRVGRRWGQLAHGVTA